MYIIKNQLDILNSNIKCINHVSQGLHTLDQSS